MIWSYSAWRDFTKCPRMWFYKNKMASSLAKDETRKEAFILSQLRTMYAWRGSLVDTVIHEAVIPSLNKGIIPNANEVLEYATSLADSQLHFARHKRYRDANLTKGFAGNAYCALYEVEYDNSPSDELVEQCKEDARKAMVSFLKLDLLEELIRKRAYLISQRPLIFNLHGFSIRCTPDMIAFLPDECPSIVDWKVHSFANTSAFKQLGVYAIALSQVKPHRDFPHRTRAKLINPSEISLIEYQLLVNSRREYTINLDEISELEDFICMNASRMQMMEQGLKFGESAMGDFPTAYYPQTCDRCNFKKMCWRANKYENS